MPGFASPEIVSRQSNVRRLMENKKAARASLAEGRGAGPTFPTIDRPASATVGHFSGTLRQSRLDPRPNRGECAAPGVLHFGDNSTRRAPPHPPPRGSGGKEKRCRLQVMDRFSETVRGLYRAINLAQFCYFLITARDSGCRQPKKVSVYTQSRSITV